MVRDGEPVDVGGLKRITVLASLLIELGHAVSPAVLIDHVWGDEPPPSADTSLQAYISNLRRMLEPGRRAREASTVLFTQAAGYAIVAPRSALDVTTFEDLLRTGHDALGRGEALAAAQVLDRALDVWRGPPLPELAGEHWVDAFAARLSQMHAQVLEDRFEAGLALGEHAALVPRIEAAITDEPFRERFRAQLALALFRSGRQRDALQSLQTARAVLLDEAGIDMGTELRQLEADILAQSPALDAPPASTGAARGAPVPETAPTSPRVAAASRGFVGRQQELQVLLDAAAAAADGAGRPVVISGEPGIGKTRLVEELTARVPHMLLAWGRCPETAGQAAYWPCIQVAQQLEAETERDDIVATMSSDLVDGSDRFAHHLAIARALAHQRQPLVIVIDDLQWADAASLRVLEIMAGELRGCSTLVVITMRPLGPDASLPLVDCVAELARQPGAARIDLAGLTERDVEDWLGDRGAPGVAEVVHDRTDGNAFFVQEVIELLAGEGRLADAESVAQSRRVPAAVQDVIRRRVARLPVDLQQLLTTASAIGRWFDVDVLAAVAEVAMLDVLDRLEPGLHAGIVDETDLPGRFAFAHALVADTLAAELSAARRARLHAAIRTALGRLRAADLDSHVAEIAHHAFEGIAAGGAEEALDWTLRSARAARARVAFEDAVQEYNRALHALSLARPADRETRLQILHELALAHLGLDSVGDAFPVIEQAISLAIDLGDIESAGDIGALTNVSGLWFAGELGITTANVVPALERALAVYPAEPSTTRALMLGGVAESAYWRYPIDQLDRISAEAVADARAVGDPEVLVRSLLKRMQALWRASRLDDRVAAAAELQVLVRQGLPPLIEAGALYGIAATAWERCDAITAERHLVRARELASLSELSPLVTQLDLFQAAIHIWHGRFDAADRKVDEFYELYRRTRRWSGESFRGGYKALLAMERGDLEEMRAHWDALQTSPYRPAFAEIFAMLLCELGQVEEAAAIVAGGLPPLVDSWIHLGVIGAAAHARVGIGDKQGAAALRDHLRPFVGSIVAMGTGPGFGDIGFALARVQLLLGDEADARRLINASLKRLSRSGPGPWLARALLFRARLTGSEQDEQAARQIVDDLRLEGIRQRM